MEPQSTEAPVIELSYSTTSAPPPPKRRKIGTSKNYKFNVFCLLAVRMKSFEMWYYDNGVAAVSGERCNLVTTCLEPGM
jgi:hypothetical protein